MVELLLGNGALIKARNRSTNTPLHLTALKGHTGVVELLLQKGAFFEALSSNRNTPMHPAALSGYTRTVKLLLQKGASVQTLNWYRLHTAAQNGHSSSIVELLLGTGVSIETMGLYSYTLLHLAVALRWSNWCSRATYQERCLG